MTGQRRAPNADAVALRYEEDVSAAATAAPQRETQYLWFNSFLRPEGEKSKQRRSTSEKQSASTKKRV